MNIEMYCGACDRHTKHKFLGNFRDGSCSLGRYLCRDCGMEQDGEDTVSLLRRGILIEKPRIDWTPEEVEAWDQYAHGLANKIAYDRFCGILPFSLHS